MIGKVNMLKTQIDPNSWITEVIRQVKELGLDDVDMQPFYRVRELIEQDPGKKEVLRRGLEFYLESLLPPINQD